MRFQVSIVHTNDLGARRQCRRVERALCILPIGMHLSEMLQLGQSSGLVVFQIGNTSDHGASTLQDLRFEGAHLLLGHLRLILCHLQSLGPLGSIVIQSLHKWQLRLQHGLGRCVDVGDCRVVFVRFLLLCGYSFFPPFDVFEPLVVEFVEDIASSCWCCLHESRTNHSLAHAFLMFELLLCPPLSPIDAVAMQGLKDFSFPS
mmetsp:Transcript_26938/g.58631  ORF Transcript_26938/g.58631 Transcript_26938/m.58631 type:complete len:203 (+) Transcript_26938:1103-1711(+)